MTETIPYTFKKLYPLEKQQQKSGYAMNAILSKTEVFLQVIKKKN